MNLKEQAKKLKTDILGVFITMRKKETPIMSKLIAGLTVVYTLSPIDLIPDFIPLHPQNSPVNTCFKGGGKNLQYML